MFKKFIFLISIVFIFLNCSSDNFPDEYNIGSRRIFPKQIEFNLINDTILQISTPEEIITINPLKIKYITWCDYSNDVIKYHYDYSIYIEAPSKKIWIMDDFNKSNFKKLKKILNEISQKKLAK